MTDLEAVPGVGPSVAKKLRQALVTTAELLAVQNPTDLREKTALGEGICEKVVRAARKEVGKFGFRSGLEIEQELASKPFLKTGLEQLDCTLMGGVEQGSILELYGPARGGKTMWCSHLAVRVQLPIEQGGLEGRVLWLDTEKSFTPRTIRAIAHRFGLDPDIALGNISRARVVLAAQIMELFETVPQMCAENNYKLVIVDSLTSLFRAEYIGLDALKTRQQEINGILNQMRRVAAATDAVFAYTNQVMAGIGGYVSIPNLPVGGHIISHASDYRFYTRAKKGGVRVLELQDNAGLPEFSMELFVGWGGFFGSAEERAETEPEVKEFLEKNGYSTALPEPKTEATAEAEEESE